ncbi:MAG: phenylalanine--tRNA ligase subunit alpha [Candidatus Doudnabacteria bacterium]
MNENLAQLKNQAMNGLDLIKDLAGLDAFVLKYFGRKQGQLTNILRSLKNLDESGRKSLGKEANEIKIEIWHLIDQKRRSIKNAGKKEFIDLTADGEKPALGHLHPITQMEREIISAFKEMGFAVMLGPEIESDYYNFESLNIPKDHPARDMWDTFYIKNDENRSIDRLALRPHTSPMQARIMEKYKPPFSVIIPGRTFRNEATDARHEHTFYQVEGLVVGENISAAHLKGALTRLLKLLFGDKIKMQFRPSYFPFTEPSIEVLMSCIFCSDADKVGSEPRPERRGGRGCAVCSYTGWLEILGSGMVHPKVFEYAGYPKGKYSGFAFGLGTLRMAMLKYNIPDVRMFYQNDIRFLKQF